MPSQSVLDRIWQFILDTLESLRERGEISKEVRIEKDARLIGDDAIIDSRSLVELLLALEEFIDEEYGAAFDWSSDRAMSAKNSPFQTPCALADFAAQEAGL